MKATKSSQSKKSCIEVMFIFGGPWCLSWRGHAAYQKYQQ
jgi:hypothetical protein